MQDNTPIVKVEKATQYKKDLKKIQKKYKSIEKDLEDLTEKLEAGETPGDRINGNQYEVYKVRVKNSDINKGQSGGYRVIYYTKNIEKVLLTAIYSKSEQANITNKEIETRIKKYELQEEEEQQDQSDSEYSAATNIDPVIPNPIAEPEKVIIKENESESQSKKVKKDTDYVKNI
jgi:mRNA-degrading endonuclease RelE of RelBE toxin-antitoxin system